ncbi:hypothetical protein TorRG33x02_004840, partial [Trema orientale]
VQSSPAPDPHFRSLPPPIFFSSFFFFFFSVNPIFQYFPKIFGCGEGWFAPPQPLESSRLSPLLTFLIFQPLTLLYAKILAVQARCRWLITRLFLLLINPFFD